MVDFLEAMVTLGVWLGLPLLFVGLILLFDYSWKWIPEQMDSTKRML